MARPKKNAAVKPAAKTIKEKKTEAVQAKEAKVEEVKAEEVQTEEVKVETSVETSADVEAVVVDVPVDSKKTTAKKTTARKTTAKKETEVKIYIQHGCDTEVSEYIEKAKTLSEVKSPKTVNIYIKPEDNKVYYVVDDVNGDFDLF